MVSHDVNTYRVRDETGMPLGDIVLYNDDILHALRSGIGYHLAVVCDEDEQFVDVKILKDKIDPEQTVVGSYPQATEDTNSVFGIRAAIIAVNNVLRKHDDIIHPVHGYQLKQALEALGKMHDGGLT